MYKFAETNSKVEIVNKYYQIEAIQVNLMRLVTKKNSQNEMILKFIEQLDKIKSNYNRYELDIAFKNPDQTVKD